MKKGNNPLSAEDFETAAEETGAVILDTRLADVFRKAFVPNSVNIGLKGDFAPWVGAMIADVKQPILLVTENGTEEEAITRLSRVGFDNVIGYLDGGFSTWQNSGKETDEINRISAEEFAEKFNENSVVIDVRKHSEYEAEHVNEAFSKPLDAISDWAGSIDSDAHFFIHCAGGYRSMIAASILNSRGIRNFSEVEGGFKAISEVGKVPVSNFVCQSKTLN
jgi:rhodanese-related sulfurtransferase